MNEIIGHIEKIYSEGNFVQWIDDIDLSKLTKGFFQYKNGVIYKVRVYDKDKDKMISMSLDEFENWKNNQKLTI